MDFLKSLASNKLPQSPAAATPKLVGRKGPVVKGRRSTAKPNLPAIRANVDRRGRDDVLASLESVYGSDLAAAHLAAAMAANPAAVEAVRQRTKHPVNFNPSPGPSFADSQAFQDRYYANQRRDRTVSAMAKYPDSAPTISSLFKMGGGSFNPIQRRSQVQSNPFYTPPANQGATPMGGGSKVGPDDLQRDWAKNHPNDLRPFPDFL